jgi:hypothetical protein
MQDLDGFPPLINLVVNPDRCMKEAADILALVDCYAEVRKQIKNFDVGKKALAKLGGRVRIVYPDVVKNFPKVV